MIHKPTKFLSALVLSAVGVLVSPGQTFTNLANFDSTNGAIPKYAPLVQGIDGNLYGTTAGGLFGGTGTIFKMSPSGTLSTVYAFTAASVNGNAPFGGLIQATNGKLYGTTSAGGAAGDGTIFSVTGSGTLSMLHSFSGAADGMTPYASLLEASDGALYGTTYSGSQGYGEVFKMTLDGTFSVLHIFSGVDGQAPAAALIQASDGNLYGTTTAGGSYGSGTVFQLTPAGTLTTIYNFSGADGSDPFGALVQATNGLLYGTTQNGGANGAGTVFSMTLTGGLTTLHSFNYTDGGQSFGALLQGTDGNLYGTTFGTRLGSGGTVFMVDASGNFTNLHTFTGTDGINPQAGLLQDTNGAFYGVTLLGGTGSPARGTAFELATGLSPFVKALPMSGKSGTLVNILVNNLKGATSVTFDGKNATFAVVSASAIAALVPVGATSGQIVVTTPAGTFSTYVPFGVPAQ